MGETDDTVRKLVGDMGESDWIGIAQQGGLQSLVPYREQEVTETLWAVTRELDNLRAVTEHQIEVIGENTQAIVENTQRQSGGGVASVIGEVGKSVSGLFTSGVAFLPVLSGLVSLFGHSKSVEEAPPATYSMPPAMNLEYGLEGDSGLVGGEIYYDQSGQPRVTATDRTVYAPQVTVQVQALDSRSFLDHSNEIAKAVREAVLNAHSLNEVLYEL